MDNEVTIHPSMPINGVPHVCVGYLSSNKVIAVCGVTGAEDEAESIANAIKIANAFNAYSEPTMSAESLRVLGIIGEKIEDGTLFRAGIFSNKELADIVKSAHQIIGASAYADSRKAAIHKANAQLLALSFNEALNRLKKIEVQLPEHQYKKVKSQVEELSSFLRYQLKEYHRMLDVTKIIEKYGVNHG